MTMHEDVINKIVNQPGKYLGVEGVKSHALIFTKVLFNSEVSLLELEFESNKIRLYIKTLLINEGEDAYKDGQIVSEYEILKTVYGIYRAHSSYRTPRPVAILREEKTIVMEECAGGSYYNYVFNNSTFFKSIFTTDSLKRTIGDCGKWIKLFHKNMPVQGDASDILR